MKIRAELLRGLSFVTMTFPAQAALGDAAVVLDAQVADGRISVTIAHPDTGWDHYADAWEVFDDRGNSLGMRTLLHPHVAEQPFTRSLAIDVPDDVTALTIRARCSVDGWSETEYRIDLAD